MTDFALRPDLTGRVPGARALLSRLSRRVRPAESAAAAAVLPVPSSTVPSSTADNAVADGPTQLGDVRTAEDLACSWPAFVRGAAVGDLRWLDTPSGPCLVGSFVPPVPRSLR